MKIKIQVFDDYGNVVGEEKEFSYYYHAPEDVTGDILAYLEDAQDACPCTVCQNCFREVDDVYVSLGECQFCEKDDTDIPDEPHRPTSPLDVRF